jgi:rRNA maturation endonuclease Nob1
MEEKKIWRANLKKYFKHVYKCKLCRKSFGSDKSLKTGFHCPICLGTLRKVNRSEEDTMFMRDWKRPTLLKLPTQ